MNAPVMSPIGFLKSSFEARNGMFSQMGTRGTSLALQAFVHFSALEVPTLSNVMCLMCKEPSQEDA